ncbi:MAG: tetratricopeptide repeat protein, partial [Elusimicrobiota bacterium]
MNLRAHLGLVEPLGRLFFLGRSSSHIPSRARVIRRASFEAALKKIGRVRTPAARAARGRLLRLLDRLDEARVELDAAAKTGRADALAWRWELSTVAGPARPQDLEAALKLEPANPEWLTWEAVRLAEAVRRDEAVTVARRAAVLMPREALPNLVEGLAWLADGRPLEAEAALSAGLARDPGVEWAYRARALARHDLGLKEKCLEDCFEAMRRNEMIGTLFIPLGLARRQVSTRDNIDAASRELEKDPKAFWALVYRSDYRREPSINENAGALEDLKSALAIKPDCAWAWAYLARCQTASGDFAGARESLEKGVALDPKCGWIRSWRGEHARRAGKTRAALSDLEKALAAEPDYELAYAWRGGAWRALGKPRRALADLDASIALDPTYVEWCYFERMNAHRELGNIGDALEDLQSAHALNPKFVWENDPKKFSAALKALAKVPVRDPRRGLALAWRGEILLRMRDFPGAEKELSLAVKAAPKLPLARLLRGRGRAGRDRWSEAMPDFEAAVALSADNGVALAWRGKAKLRSGDATGACADLTAALRSRTEKAAAWIYCWKAEAELAAGRPEDAEHSAAGALELHPRYAEARLWRGLARAARGAGADALADLRAAGAGDLTEEARAKLDAALTKAEALEQKD